MLCSLWALLSLFFFACLLTERSQGMEFLWSKKGELEYQFFPRLCDVIGREKACANFLGRKNGVHDLESSERMDLYQEVRRSGQPAILQVATYGAFYIDIEVCVEEIRWSSCHSSMSDCYWVINATLEGPLLGISIIPHFRGQGTLLAQVEEVEDTLIQVMALEAWS